MKKALRNSQQADYRIFKMTHQGALFVHDPGRGGGGGVFRMMAHTGRLRSFRLQVYQRVGI